MGHFKSAITIVTNQCEMFDFIFTFPQKLNNTVLSFSINSLSKVNKEAQNNSFGMANVLIIWILPKTVRFLHCQLFKVFFKDFRIASKFNSFFRREL